MEKDETRTCTGDNTCLPICIIAGIKMEWEEKRRSEKMRKMEKWREE